MLEETDVTCPYCWERIPAFVDLSAGSQTYVEDCSVCCNPITFFLTVGSDESGYELQVMPENE